MVDKMLTPSSSRFMLEIASASETLNGVNLSYSLPFWDVYNNKYKYFKCNNPLNKLSLYWLIILRDSKASTRIIIKKLIINKNSTFKYLRNSRPNSWSCLTANVTWSITVPFVWRSIALLPSIASSLSKTPFSFIKEHIPSRTDLFCPWNKSNIHSFTTPVNLMLVIFIKNSSPSINVEQNWKNMVCMEVDIFIGVSGSDNRSGSDKWREASKNFGILI